MSYEPADVCLEDAPSTLEFALAHTRAGAEAIRRGGGIFATTRLAAEIEAIRQCASILIKFDRLNTPPDAFGFEHEVWFPPHGEKEPRVLKATYGNEFGARPNGDEAAPSDYFERLLLQNRVFGDNVVLVGVCECRVGVLRVVTSQPAVAGRPAEADEIQSFFIGSGFHPAHFRGSAVWFRQEDRMLCSDTHGGNILVTEAGALVAIDVPIMHAPQDFEALAKMEKTFG